MRSLKIRLLGALSVAILAGMVVAADPTLSADLSGQTVKADVEHLNKLMTLLTNKKKGIYPRLKTTALMVALNAQDQLGGKDAAKMAATRDAALKVVAAVVKKDNTAIGDAIKELENVKADAKADTKPIPLKKILDTAKLDSADVMEVFSKSAGGGMNLEEDIRAMKKGVTDAKAAALAGARISLIADMTIHVPNEKGAADKATWEKYSKDMRGGALDLLKEAASAKPDLGKLKSVANKIDASCVNCHNKFQ